MLQKEKMTLETKTSILGKPKDFLTGNPKSDLNRELKISTTGSKQTFILDFDDFCSITPGYDLLKKLKEHFPKFKCTCFTTPFHIKYFKREVPVSKLKVWGKLVNELDWIEIAPHGFSHLRGEWLITDKKQIEIQLKAMQNLFTQIGIDYVKIFKAPFWEYTKEVEEVLTDYGYTLAIDRNNPVVRTNIPTYVWNWSMERPIPEYHTIKGHGHIHGTNNGLDVCYPNLLKLPRDAIFKFVSEYE